jgi:translation elongation factor EF-4
MPAGVRQPVLTGHESGFLCAFQKRGNYLEVGDSIDTEKLAKSTILHGFSSMKTVV